MPGSAWWEGTRLVAGRSLSDGLRSRTVRVTTLILLLVGLAVVFVPRMLSGDEPTYTLATIGEASASVQAQLDAAGEAADFGVEYLTVADAPAVEACRPRGGRDRRARRADHVRAHRRPRRLPRPGRAGGRRRGERREAAGGRPDSGADHRGVLRGPARAGRGRAGAGRGPRGRGVRRRDRALHGHHVQREHHRDERRRGEVHADRRGAAGRPASQPDPRRQRRGNRSADPCPADGPGRADPGGHHHHRRPGPARRRSRGHRARGGVVRPRLPDVRVPVRRRGGAGGQGDRGRLGHHARDHCAGPGLPRARSSWCSRIRGRP